MNRNFPADVPSHDSAALAHTQIMCVCEIHLDPVRWKPFLDWQVVAATSDRAATWVPTTWVPTRSSPAQGFTLVGNRPGACVRVQPACCRRRARMICGHSRPVLAAAAAIQRRAPSSKHLAGPGLPQAQRVIHSGLLRATSTTIVGSLRIRLYHNCHHTLPGAAAGARLADAVCSYSVGVHQLCPLAPKKLRKVLRSTGFSDSVAAGPDHGPDRPAALWAMLWAAGRGLSGRSLTIPAFCSSRSTGSRSTRSGSMSRCKSCW